MEDQKSQSQGQTKFCKFCGEKIPVQAVICPHCGGQVEELKAQPNIVINNTNTNTNANTIAGRPSKECNKWIAFFLCLFLGMFGAHKFYEGKIGLGLVYIFTGGVFMIGVLVDLITIALKKTTTYYV